MQTKTVQRKRRARRARGWIERQGATRLSVHRTPRHIYAQITQPDGSRTLASASTVESVVANECQQTGNVAAAEIVGRTIAERAQAIGVDTVAFDRSGFAYHGRVRALADAARDGGLKF
ncbi:50S ribosomal protein L18 [Salinisphaera sp. USBA-960]|uniref:50S ribosomal protein L18 n=1 Tax=Salinisphaera orenii TaxID=856731 RepID=UPI000DBE1533|nr:50S ribosomal protein L18 [Salifodinibacter halophilus]NNC26676.1 50S ribosomal protein L18 [Salifodinibacter halophilus]